MGASPTQSTVQSTAQSIATQVALQSMESTSSDPSPDTLTQLVLETCGHPKGSPPRQRGMTKLIRILTRQLWHTYDAYYPDALQQTWIYFCRNLCEATTGKAYDPQVAKVTTWLNAYLRRRLQDFQIAENKQRATTISQSAASDRDGNGPLDPIDRLAAPPDIPPWLEQVRAWAEQDEDGQLQSMHVGKHEHVTAQLLILRRLPPETPWKTLSNEYNISVGTLSSFYQRKCLTQLRAYGKAQGFF